MIEHSDHFYMTRALDLARQGLGRVWPNPAVGCVLVRDGVVVGEGRTADGGRPHAERVALEMAGDRARGATAYVTLEPCYHDRADGSCSANLIEAGVSEVVVAVADPDPRTSGRAIDSLRQAGLVVREHVLEEEARALQQGFFLRMAEGRPFVTLKLASSSDDKIAGGAYRWITGEEARCHVHEIRASFDAILVGSGTVHLDDPLLTTRVEGLSHNIVRVVLDRALGISQDSKLVQTARGEPLWIFHCERNFEKEQVLETLGARLFCLPDLSVPACLCALAEQGITRLLLEGGAKIYHSFWESGMVDEVLWYRSSDDIGPSGLDAFAGQRLEDVFSPLFLEEELEFGRDRFRRYSKQCLQD